MKTPMLVVLASITILGACSRGGAAPGDATGVYIVRSVNGHSLPRAVEYFTSADGKSCTSSLYDGLLNLYGQNYFDFDLSLVTVCDGNPTVPSTDRSTGSYTQAGALVTFQPQTEGMTHISTADLSGGQLRTRGVRSGGTTLELVLEKQQTVQTSGPTATQ